MRMPQGDARQRRWSVFVLLLWLLGLAAGCGGGPGYPSATVTGTVTVDGNPVPKGSITFSPVAKGQGTVVGAEITGGKYTCPNVPLGKNRVTFICQAAETQTIYDAANQAERQVPITIQLAPEFQAGVEKEVTEGQNTIDFPLKGSKPKP